MQEYEYKCNCWCLKYVLRKGPGTRQNLLRLRLVLLVFPEFCLPSFLLSLVSFFFPTHKLQTLWFVSLSVPGLAQHW